MRISSRIKFLLSLGVITAIVAFAFWLSQTVSDNEYLQTIIGQYGYFGIFIAAVISGFNIIVPIPAVSFIPALIEAGANYQLSILILALGMTVADVIAYILGRAGRGVFADSLGDKLVSKLDKLKDKHPIFPFTTIFLFASFVPVPNEIIVMPLGFLRFKVVYVIIAVFLGNLVFNTIYSKGFIELFRLF